MSSDKFIDAKNDEISKWKQMDVFQEVENTGQSLMSTRWICTEKIKGGAIICKARLVARGFEEDDTSLMKNSPTCTKDAFRLLLSLLVLFPYFWYYSYILVLFRYWYFLVTIFSF